MEFLVRHHPWLLPESCSYRAHDHSFCHKTRANRAGATWGDWWTISSSFSSLNKIICLAWKPIQAGAAGTGTGRHCPFQEEKGLTWLFLSYSKQITMKWSGGESSMDSCNIPFIVSAFPQARIRKCWLTSPERKGNILLEARLRDYQVGFYLVSIINHYWAHLIVAKM